LPGSTSVKVNKVKVNKCEVKTKNEGSTVHRLLFYYFSIKLFSNLIFIRYVEHVRQFVGMLYTYVKVEK